MLSQVVVVVVVSHPGALHSTTKKFAGVEKKSQDEFHKFVLAAKKTRCFVRRLLPIPSCVRLKHKKKTETEGDRNREKEIESRLKEKSKHIK